MKLSDIMSAAGLTLYPMIALVLFLAAFLVVAVRLLLPGREARWERDAALPLEDINDRFVTAQPTADGAAARQTHEIREQRHHAH